MKTCECGSDVWHYNDEFLCAKCGKKAINHFFCVHCGKEFREATGELLQKHIRECPEHPLPKALAECERLQNVIHEVVGEMEKALADEGDHTQFESPYYRLCGVLEWPRAKAPVAREDPR